MRGFVLHASWPKTPIFSFLKEFHLERGLSLWANYAVSALVGVLSAKDSFLISDLSTSSLLWNACLQDSWNSCPLSSDRDKGPCSQSSDFSGSHAQMWQLDHKEGWAPKNWCLWIVMLEKTLETPLDSRDIKPVNPKGNQSWIFIEGLMLKLKLQYFSYLMLRADSLEKTLILGKIEGKKRRGHQRMKWLDGITDSMGINLSKL